MAQKKRWYAMTAKAEEGKTVAEIRIYDEIGFWGMTAKDFVRELDAVAKDASAIVVSINSPGGDVFDAFAIYNALKRHSLQVTTRVDGVAASAASLILMAGDKVVMPGNAMVMIHNAWTIAAGTATELRDVADMMDKVGDGIIAAYAGKSNLGAEEIAQMMDATTWLTAQEAQTLGFCDEIEQPVKIAASASMSAVLAKHKDTPAGVLALFDDEQPDDLPLEDPPSPPPPEPQPKVDPAASPAPAPGLEPIVPENSAEITAHIFATCRAEGIPHMAEGVLMSGGLQSKAAADTRIKQAQDIAGICLAAKLPDTAADFIKAGLSVEQVRARLFDQVVQASAETINSLPQQDASPKAKTGPNAGNIYAARTTNRRAAP